EVILRTALRVLPGGGVYDHAYFFRNQNGVNRLGADLVTLGFEVPQPFSQHLPGIVARLRGVRFRARKAESKGGDGRVYHNLHVNSRPVGSPMPAASAPQSAGVSSNSDDVPF